MQTQFTEAQLADPDIKEADGILRACVHCGFCTATCPTYVLLGDELDSPRGRIYLIKDMLENDREPSPRVVKHIDRCLSCLACMTTCPSGVHYQHLVDHARAHIEERYGRPLPDRLTRRLLAFVLPYPGRFRWALLGATLARPFAWIFPARLRAMLALAPRSLPSPSPEEKQRVFAAAGRRRGRVALLAGCAQRVIAPEINEATIRLLTRHGIEVVVPAEAGCCGALVHHMGRRSESHLQAAANIHAWTREIEGEGLDAILVNTSGCGTQVKDYGFMFRHDPELKEAAARVSAITRDVSEYLADIRLNLQPPATDLRVAYHPACSLQHGQKVTEQPKALLRQAGFTVVLPREAHLCCGSAGTYNMMQPELATRLRDRKVHHLEETCPDVIVTGNIGCITQIASATEIPVVHTVELLDWATGGPRPRAQERT